MASRLLLLRRLSWFKYPLVDSVLIFRPAVVAIESIQQSTRPLLTSSDHRGTLLGNSLNLLQKRFRKRARPQKGGGGGKGNDEEEDSDEEEEEEDSDDEEFEAGGPDTKVVNSTAASMRLDAVGKAVFNISRAKFDECFYKGLVRIDGERVGKKSVEVKENEELDLINGFNIENRDQLDITRVKILKVDDKASSSGRIRFTFQKTNSLTIDNYESDPHVG